jgi:DNA-binding response OmpR family regulator
MGPRPILVVDDDLDIREALAETLQDHGFEVFTAANGLEALSWVREAKVSPSVVLLDLMMPVLDGYAFLAEWRKDPALQAIPVAIITAGHRIDYARLGDAALVLPKPLEVQHLVNTLRTLQSPEDTP